MGEYGENIIFYNPYLNRINSLDTIVGYSYNFFWSSSQQQVQKQDFNIIFGFLSSHRSSVRYVFGEIIQIDEKNDFQLRFSPQIEWDSSFNNEELDEIYFINGQQSIIEIFPYLSLGEIGKYRKPQVISVVATQTLSSFVSFVTVFKNLDIPTYTKEEKKYKIQNVPGYNPVKIYLPNYDYLAIHVVLRKEDWTKKYRSQNLVLIYDLKKIDAMDEMEELPIFMAIDDKKLMFDPLKQEKLFISITGNRKEALVLDIALETMVSSKDEHMMIQGQENGEFVNQLDIIPEIKVYSLELNLQSVWTIHDFKLLSPSVDKIILRGLTNEVEIDLNQLVTSYYDPATRVKEIIGNIILVLMIGMVLAVVLLLIVLIKRCNLSKKNDRGVSIENSVIGNYLNENDDDFGSINDFEKQSQFFDRMSNENTLEHS